MAPIATVSKASATQRLAGARRPFASRRARCVGVVAALPPNLRHRVFCRPHPSLAPLRKFNATRAPRIRSGSTRVTATVADVATQNVYTFGKGKGQGDASMKALLGGKGANLAEMCAIGLSVPPGMTITTETCAAFHANGSKLPEGVWEEVLAGLAEVETEMGTKLGDAANPLLLSVRSGAAVSMPGMMDTVLNLGLNDTVVEGLAAKAGKRFAYDSYRRFLDMFGAVVMGLPHEAFETELESLKTSRGVSEDTDLSSDDLRELVELYKGVYSARGVAFPQEPLEQLRAGIYAVFDSWMSERANVYRRINGITGLKGTAVNVQAMAYGNLGDTSGTGVCFTRSPSTGEAVLYGEYLINAQGEDVVAGIRTPEPIARLAADLPEAYAELVANCNLLEAHYKDMQDIEFTVQEGRLFMLQCRSGKRTGAGAVRIAVDMVGEGLVSREEAVCMVEPTHVDQLLHPRFEDEAAYQSDVIGKGLPASPGATTGVVVFRAEDAESMHAAGQDAILVRTETSPEDVGGMWAAAGVLTARGGMTSHAAVVARGWGKTCVSGCGELSVDEAARTASLGGVTIREGDWLSLNGSTGEVIAGKQPMRPAELSAELAQLMEWADASRTMSVLTNADTPDDAAAARANGAEGIGLVRTEHMFFASDERLSAVRRMILAQSDAARAEALESLLPFQQADFEGIFTAMDGLPVTIRLLDPPLHEFLPHGEEEEVVAQLADEAGMDATEVEETIFRLAEVNPMLGFRGCRLAITYPEIGAMQVRAILQAACAVQKAGVVVRPDIMVPLVGTPEELAMQEAMVREVADTVMAEQGETVNYRVGTMIEVPRACLVADDIAAHAEFFSFGTNDLTQMTYGYSRDDVNKFLPIYLDKGILPVDPFQSLDQKGVGQLIEMATTKGRSARRDLKVGICGEQGGDPASVEFVHRVGLDYVSCSPFRVPIARLAAAQAAIKHGRPSK